MSNELADEAAQIQAFDELFAYVESFFRLCLEELRSHGIEPDPNLQLRRSKGLSNYYDLSDGNIYMAIPDLKTATGRFSKLFISSALSIEDDRELLSLYRFLAPRTLAHELGHHLRHHYGRFQRENLWHEEQVANQFAMAIIKRRLTPQQKQEARRILSRAIGVLRTQMESKDAAIDSYRDLAQALNVSEQLGDDALDSIELIRSVFLVDIQSLIRASGEVSTDVMERLERRGEVINTINEEYSADYLRYIYYHLGWLYFDLLSNEFDYIDEFRVNDLGITPWLLPIVDLPANPEQLDIRALYRAYLDLKDRSEIGRRFFYKRYRSSLLNRFQNSKLNAPGGQIQANLPQLLEMWEEGRHDVIRLLSVIAPPELKNICPEYLEAHADSSSILPGALPTETDRRLWQFWMTGEADEEARNTAERMQILERTQLLRPMPAEVQLWFVHHMFHLRLKTGDPVVWISEKSGDVFILLSGSLEACIPDGNSDKVVGIIRPGEVFGEISFITREPRSATVRAIEPSECIVLKGSHLRPVAFNHPALLVMMSTMLATRLRRQNLQ